MALYLIPERESAERLRQELLMQARQQMLEEQKMLQERQRMMEEEQRKLKEQMEQERKEQQEEMQRLRLHMLEQQQAQVSYFSGVLPKILLKKDILTFRMY